SLNPPTSFPAAISICPPQAMTYMATVTGATSLQWQQQISGVWTTIANVTPGGNLALNKPATQSSTYPGGDAGHAVDGNTSGQWGDGSVTATQADAQAWWQVDLGASALIQTVNLWNRMDCCSDRLGAFYLFVSDVPFTSTSLADTLAQAGVWNYYTPG